MAMGKRRRSQQQAEMWLPADRVAKAPSHPFYSQLNKVFEKAGFDEFVEKLCRPYYADIGRPGIAPGIYFRMLMIGFFEGIDSERGIAWRVADSLALRSFLGYSLTKETPHHSTLSVIRNRLPGDAFDQVFSWILQQLHEHKLVKGNTIGIDATTLEANAAMRSILRRDTGESYQEYLQRLAEAAGIEDPTREDLAKLDRKRKKKGSNDDWFNPNDPDAKIAKMKDGRTHLAHKAEHAVDLETGATVAVTVQAADLGDTETAGTTLCEAMENVADCTSKTIKEVVADKGYHSNDILRDLSEANIRTYISEPDRGRRNWKGKARERAAVHANRRRIRGKRGTALLRKRGEMVERPFAHHYETGRMRRTHLREHVKILKRLLIHSGACNLALLMRTLFGIGTPRGLQSGADALIACVVRLLQSFMRLCGRVEPSIARSNGFGAPSWSFAA